MMTPAIAWWISLSLRFLFLPPAGTVQAHSLRTAYVEITEAQPGRALVRVRLPVAASGVDVRLPPDCELQTLSGVRETDSGPVRTYRATCKQPLSGRAVAIAGLGPTISEATLYYIPPAGTPTAALLTRTRATQHLPTARGTSFWVLTTRYLVLGFEHVRAGWDHLLFVCLLVLVLQRPRPVFLAEAAFTVSHTVSFAVTALGLLRLPSAAVEACIALSLLLLALDVDLRELRRSTDLHQALWTPLVFGLVHGLGFAGGLQDAGLPAVHAGQAALGFGLGVELGQLICSALALALVTALRRWGRYPAFAAGATYAVGVTAAYWFLTRLHRVLV